MVVVKALDSRIGALHLVSPQKNDDFERVCPYGFFFLSTTPSQPVILPILLRPFARSSHVIGPKSWVHQKTISKKPFVNTGLLISVILHDLQVFLTFFLGTPLFFSQKITDPIPDLAGARPQEIYRRCQAPVPRPQRP